MADHVATITLNRPHRRNAISGRMLQLLTELFAQADDSPDVRVVLLTGAGKGFCSGLDIKDAMAGTGIGGSGGGGAPASFSQTRNLPTVVLQEMDTPVIAVINGAAAGYGLDLALGADMRLMAESAKLLPGFAKRGVVPESGGTWYLPRLLGWAKAAEISYLGRDLDAAESERIGLVNRAVPDDELMPLAQRVGDGDRVQRAARHPRHEAPVPPRADAGLREPLPPRAAADDAAVRHQGLPGGAGQLHGAAPARVPGSLTRTLAPCRCPTGTRHARSTGFIFRSTKRIVIFVVGVALVLLGVVLIPLPGPFSIPLMIAGLAVLATEYVWAEKVLDTVKDKAKQASEAAKRSILRRKPKPEPAGEPAEPSARSRCTRPPTDPAPERPPEAGTGRVVRARSGRNGHTKCRIWADRPWCERARSRKVVRATSSEGVMR